MCGLLEALGASACGMLVTREDARRFYSVDSSLYEVQPVAAVIPDSAEDISRIIRIARAYGTSVTVRGAGTGLVGGALNSGLILDMRNISGCRMDGDAVVVQAGTSRGMLDAVLEGHGRFFPPNPSVGPFCSVGGMVGTNASGSRSLRYGSVIDNILEVTFVDGTGRMVTLPGDARATDAILDAAGDADVDGIPDTMKNSSGYRIDAVSGSGDVHKVLAGSEGTLGVVTSVRLRTMEIPGRRTLLVVQYRSAEDAAADCPAINRTGPSAVEYLGGETLGHVDYTFDAGTECLLFVEYEGHVPDVRHAVAGRIAAALDNEAEVRRWWRYRDAAVHHAMRGTGEGESIYHTIEDAAVPLERLPELFRLISEIGGMMRRKPIVYGHAGSGNIHVLLVARHDERETIRDVTEYYLERVIGMNGTITAEHGDGLARSGFVMRQYGERNHDVFQRLKAEFDPDGILNPGKIISRGAGVIENMRVF